MSLADIRNKIVHENNIDVGIFTISEILKESEKWKQVEKNCLWSSNYNKASVEVPISKMEIALTNHKN